MRTQRRSTRVAVVALAGLAAGLGACAAEPAVHFDLPPGPRQESFPFPARFGFHKLVDPQHLGRHRYANHRSPVGPGVEQHHGTLYTCRAGFLDVACIRQAADWAKFFHVHVSQALRDGRPWLRLEVGGPTRIVVGLHYPSDWARMPEAERLALADEVAVRLAQRLSYIRLSWHEMAKWFDYRRTPVVSRKRAAFLCDATVSHLVGLRVAGQALRDGGGSYDASVTRALADQLERLHVVTRAEAREAVTRVRDRWWTPAGPRKRFVQSALDGRPVEPWIVRGLRSCAFLTAAPLRVPTLDDVRGRDLSRFAAIRIESRIAGIGIVRAALPRATAAIVPSRDFPDIVKAVRTEMVREAGPAVVEAYP